MIADIASSIVTKRQPRGSIPDSPTAHLRALGVLVR